MEAARSERVQAAFGPPGQVAAQVALGAVTRGTREQGQIATTASRGGLVDSVRGSDGTDARSVKVITPRHCDAFRPLQCPRNVPGAANEDVGVWRKTRRVCGYRIGCAFWCGLLPEGVHSTYSQPGGRVECLLHVVPLAQHMRLPPVSLTDVHSARERRWFPPGPLYRRHQTVEAQQHFYLPYGMRSFIMLRESMII